MSLLFLSHSSTNNAEALALRDWLIGEGWTNLFLDLDPERGIVAGERWERALHQAASRCDAVLFLISCAWLGSEWCRRELHLAQKLNKRVFTLLLEDIAISELPSELTDSWQVVNLASGSDHGQVREVLLQGEAAPHYVYFSQSGLQRLRAGLQKAGLDPHAFQWPPSNDPDRPPYRGLLPLEAEDAGIFFGREAPIIELLAQLRGLRESAPPRLLAILGASGAGKSSFLRAGVLPRLSRDDRHFLPLPVLRPERAVLSGKSGLVESLTAASRALNRSRWEVQQAVEGGAEPLRALLDSLAQHAAVPEMDGQIAFTPTLVLCVDQGEELFLAEGGEEAARFLGLLRDLLMQESLPLMVLFTIRSESYDQLQRAEELAGIRQHAFPLQPMPRGAYQQVIEEPAKLLARSHRPLHIDPKLTQALLDDLDKGGAKDALPLLAFTLERLYLNFGTSGRLTLEDYRQKTQGIEGAIESAVSAALAAAQGNPRLPNDREECLKLLRRGLIPWLAGIDPQTNLPRRRVARLADVPEEARAIIQHFIEHRLLSTDKNGDGEVTVEPAHEALLRQWTKLKGWLEEDAAVLSTLETVKAASRDWAANAQDDKWLIHQAGRLEDAEALHQRQDLAASLDASNRAYLAACRRQEDERRNKELMQAKELAETRRIANQRKQLALVVAIVLTSLTAVGAFLGFKGQRDARESLSQLRSAVFNPELALRAFSDKTYFRDPSEHNRTILTTLEPPHFREPGETNVTDELRKLAGAKIQGTERSLLDFMKIGSAGSVTGSLGALANLDGIEPALSLLRAAFYIEEIDGEWEEWHDDWRNMANFPSTIVLSNIESHHIGTYMLNNSGYCGRGGCRGWIIFLDMKSEMVVYAQDADYMVDVSNPDEPGKLRIAFVSWHGSGRQDRVRISIVERSCSDCEFQNISDGGVMLTESGYW